ncbi:hypothetical protein FHS95_001274 [Sphingomonas naasensis]|uniref:Glycerophosphoryl diester phosphodiesterase membrane domain-containing protein n=1 Tax=Sphingomonas naasensis TaxID=1344951 RepID=A0A4S1W7U0_9SPHN|nr:hypothetical protein [Sphingomonas naasensis]NIJ19605.1 hypothetical protein [Sphingomonas naasensis]TGX37317.1 hypothetical protein E5A74_20455 [Sphingomonas naasensis]
MTIRLAGVLADARKLWRGERELLLAIGGVFFVLPMLGIVLLLASAGFADVAPEKLREAVMAFYAANLAPILLANVAIDFGTFAVLNLYLQGGGRTLGEVLLLALRRFLPFLAIDVIAALLFSIGSSLFLLPGLFAFGRTWLAGPAYAAAPERGVLDAFRQGWQRSAGFGWVVLLAAAGLVFVAALLLMLLSTALTAIVVALVADGRAHAAVSYVLTALIGGLAWTVLALLRVAAYRGSEPRQGM